MNLVARTIGLVALAAGCAVSHAAPPGGAQVSSPQAVSRAAGIDADAVMGLLHPEQDETVVSARWMGLNKRDDIRRLDTPALKLRVVNKSNKPQLVLPRLRAITNARVRSLVVQPFALAPGARRDVRVRIPEGLYNEDRLVFAGKLYLALEVQRLRKNGTVSKGAMRKAVHVSLPALYFHGKGERLFVYREDVMRERFGAGNFRREPLEAPNPVPAVDVELARVGHDGLTPVLSFVHLAGGFPDPKPVNDILPPGSKKYCFGLDGSAFDDSAETPTIYFVGPAEDFGRHDAFVPARRAWVTLGQRGNALFSGYLDAEGCTPFVIPAPGSLMSVAFFPMYLRETNGVRGFVSDLNLGPQWPDSMPYFLIYFNSSNALVTDVYLDPLEFVHTIYVAAANAMERAPGGIDDVLYEFRLREQGDNSGTNTFYAAQGHPQVRVKYSVAARQKFTIAHEFGHALHIANLNPPLTPADLDYSVTDNQGEQHTVTSKEWQLAAAFEGFAHFVSAVVWNETVPDQGAMFRSSIDSYLLDEFDRRFESSYDPGEFPDQGVELDWAQFFWNYHTDEYQAGDEVVPAPSLPLIVDMWLTSQPWPVHEGFYDDFRDGAEAALQVLEPGVPIEDSMERFDAIAEQAGIVN